jgi:uncharacterized BrkB/YihY/UPF0761 family membrane protein
MKHDFLNDDWLKEQLHEEHLEDDNFSHAVMQKVSEQQQNTPWYLYAFSSALICAFGYLIVNLLLSLLTDAPIEKPTLIDIQWSTITNGFAVAPISIIVITLAFALIWSIEEYDLL